MRYCFLILIIILSSCLERLSVSEDDMKKYPEVLPFLLERKDLEGEHFLDQGWLHFSYIPTRSNDVIRVLDSIAISENWKIEKTSDLERVYLKEIKSYPSDTGLDSLIVSYSTKNNRLIFKWH